MRDALPYAVPVSERISYVYLERARIERDGHTLVAKRDGGETTQIPVGRTAVLMLGPGCSITHAAVALCALESATVLWTGERGVRLYAHGNPRGDGTALLRQARIRLDPRMRLVAAREIWRLMFDESPHPKHSLEQLRGDEGQRVKSLFTRFANECQVEWTGRIAGGSDPLNNALDVANSCLYGLTEAVILAIGLSPAIGFVHAGDPRSFVFDIADTIKFKSIIPAAFHLVAESRLNIEPRTRRMCRDVFYDGNLASCIIANTMSVMDATTSD